ncbi:MAG: hypothetical protein H6Q17_505 [Bacteroidetes bacterium]|jgi:hypothetical protein|nr:hypothetical protein [Bacteroidota bacterium]
MVYEEWMIVKEFEAQVPGYPHTIKARILQLKSRSPNKIYYGTVSHYYKPNEQALEVVMPTGQGNSIAAIERELNVYLKAFTSIGVVVNDDFDCLIY